MPLASRHQNIQRFGSAAGDLIVEVHIRDIKRNVLFGVPTERFTKFVFTHLWQDDVLDDHRVAADSGCNSRGSNLVFVEDVCNNIGNVIELHDLTVDNRIGLQIFKAQVDQLIRTALLLEFDSLYGAGADVEANQILFAVTFVEHDLFIPRCEEGAEFVLLSESCTRFHSSR